MAINQFTSSAMVDDIEEVVSSSPATLHDNYTLIIHNEEEGEGGEVETHFVLSVDEIRDYASNHTDHVLVQAAVLEGDYRGKIVPYANKLEATLITHSLGGDSHARYRLMITPSENNANKDHFHNLNVDDLNIGGMAVYGFQLISIYKEPLLLPRISGIYSNVTAKALLTEVSKKAIAAIQIEGSKPIEKVDVVNPSNTEPRAKFVINTGTGLLDLPALVQEKMGVYHGGIGRYVQIYKGKMTYFIYPLIDSPVYSTDAKKNRLKIFLLEPTINTHDLNTYREEENLVSVVAVMVNRDTDTVVDTRIKNRPYGYIHTDAVSEVIGNGTASEGGKVISPEDDTTKEVFIKRRSDNLDIVSRSTHHHHFKAASEVLTNATKIMECQWNNSDNTLLYPGMGVTIYQEVNGVVEDREGELIHSHSVTTGARKGLTNNVFIQNTLLTINTPILT